jgi:hypothetical protein
MSADALFDTLLAEVLAEAPQYGWDTKEIVHRLRNRMQWGDLFIAKVADDSGESMERRRDLAALGRTYGWSVREGNRSQVFTHPEYDNGMLGAGMGRALVVTWDHVPSLPFTERWCKFVGAEMFIPAEDERFRDGMCGTTEYNGARRWLSDKPVSAVGHPQPTKETGEKS